MRALASVTLIAGLLSVTGCVVRRGDYDAVVSELAAAKTDARAQADRAAAAEQARSEAAQEEKKVEETLAARDRDLDAARLAASTLGAKLEQAMAENAELTARLDVAARSVRALDDQAKQLKDQLAEAELHVASTAPAAPPAAPTPPATDNVIAAKVDVPTPPANADPPKPAVEAPATVKAATDARASRGTPLSRKRSKRQR